MGEFDVRGSTCKRKHKSLLRRAVSVVASPGSRCGGREEHQCPALLSLSSQSQGLAQEKELSSVIQVKSYFKSFYAVCLFVSKQGLKRKVVAFGFLYPLLPG